MKIYRIYLAESYQFYTGGDLQMVQKLEKNDFSDIDKIKFSLDSNNRPNLDDITTVNNACCLAFSKNAQKLFSELNFTDMKNTGFSICTIPSIDVLDFEKSIIDYFHDTKKLKRIRKYSFKEPGIGNNICFKLPIIASPVFVTQKFVDKYSQAGFNGLDFTKVYE